MKQIAKLTALTVLIATISNAGMIADDLIPPVPNQPTKKPTIMVKESIAQDKNVVTTNTTTTVEEKVPKIIPPAITKSSEKTEIPKAPLPPTVPEIKPVEKTKTPKEARITKIPKANPVDSKPAIVSGNVEVNEIVEKKLHPIKNVTAPTIEKDRTKNRAENVETELSPEKITNKMEAKTDAVIAETGKLSNKPDTESTDKKYAFFTAIGQGDGSVKSVAIGFDIYCKTRWFEGGNWYLTPYTELLASYWEGDAGHTGNESLHEGGLSIYGRYIRQKTEKLSISPYLDAGLGLHYVTEDEIEGKELGRQWLAGSNIGIGLILGKAEIFDVGLRIRHLSNGGTKDVNWGINHAMLRLAIRF